MLQRTNSSFANFCFEIKGFNLKWSPGPDKMTRRTKYFQKKVEIGALQYIMLHCIIDGAVKTAPVKQPKYGENT